MGSECIGARSKEDTAEIPLVPPGFISLTSFTLKRVNDDVTMSNRMASAGASDSRQAQMDSELHISDDAKLTRSLRRRPWINYGVFDNSSEEESDSEQLDQGFSSIRRLPKGVIRGCIECSNCQKVIARWQPKNACRPILDDAPVFHPTEEEFEDALKYIASIRQSAEPYGICRIVPPPSWKPPCPLKERDMWENSRFATRIQRVDKLQNRSSMRKMYRYYINMNRKRRRLKLGNESRTSNGDIAETNELGNLDFNERFGFEPGPLITLEAFQKYADDFKEQYFCTKDVDADSRSNQNEFQKHQEPTVENIEGEYWRLVEKPTEEIEVLYGADIETRVFGSGFPKASSVPMKSDAEDRYVKSGWNLNNFSRLPGSVLSFESGDISGVLVPWLYVGMCFSSFCWHVEDHHLYSLNYMHWGAPKMWYGVPGKDALKLEAAMKKYMPDLFEEQPDLLHKLVTQLSPSILKSEGVPVYRCVQHPGEFVLTFPRAYHSGFNCGFNCAEAVNVAPVDWLPHGQSAIELYRDQGRKTTVSHDKLLLGAAREAVRAHWELLLLRKNTLDNLRWKDVCGKDGILAKALKMRVDMERARREYLCSPSQSRKMDVSFDATSERECSVCLYDLHLSAAGCQCSPDRFTCLNHAKKLCSCGWSERFFLFRYEISELNMLVEALGGKLSAIYRWAHLDLGLALSSYVTKDKSQEPQSISKPSLERTKQNEHGSLNVVSSSTVAKISPLCQETNGSMSRITSFQEPKEREWIAPNGIDPTGSEADPSAVQKLNPSSATLASEDGRSVHMDKRTEIVYSEGRILQLRPLPKPEIGDCTLQLSEGYAVPHSNLPTLPACQLSQEDMSYTEPSESTSSEQNSLGCFKSVPKGKPPSSNLNTIETKTNRISSVEDSGVIILSDDEDEDAHGSFMGRKMDESAVTNLETSTRLVNCDIKVVPCNYPKDPVSDAPERGDVSLLTVKEKEGLLSHSVRVKIEDHGKDENRVQFNFMMPNDTSHPQNPQPLGIAKPNNEDKDEKPVLGSGLILKDRAQQPIAGSTPNNHDRYCRQKGPRIAKVVRRINYTVEPLEYGIVFSGMLWSNSQAIFPKGFRSRVRYLSVLDPTKMCYYISEILDAGLLGPLFMVKVEQCPSEVFIHVSAAKCWDMVRERVNHEIRRQHSLGRLTLPPLQPPGSLDGLEMFGFSSPTIIQGIEAIDCNRVCIEYWKSRPETQNPQPSSLPRNATGDTESRIKEEMSDDREVNDAENRMLNGTDMVLRGLFKKADPEELHSLCGLLTSDNLCSKQALIRLLDEEIQSRPQPKLPS
ncbi:putative lysine-specific demethylase JMJ16 [Magnolia sinica]|uniref:putative lysine-specific demethylase JMJ16 n=1 Tax=Magnolia sinica TaxID=86752 RepID=UPI00265ADEDE|nr:putative lysine-specific demethylase JMJ16 [Magnolia sinica]XP_058101596.1 putative lysine-specific demethylase JMJ16 [Magnolia sinica]XP_058101597.1 putative lysine-specific demethylase JMJ16 [Magnolia sinica]XP_058101598.1 putative lysine-specific demethylase JMJ16 [Magnolia sinica]XP_058101599.1 putative lysine-specific demethylase JMJ16 [Magnolia sinica]XP_058101600.1 putative lysine-specific demethylase JMJ16 [Magnolia sinica]XP_058101601.1 putative lysine-specific demethylase JMJ16 [